MSMFDVDVDVDADVCFCLCSYATSICYPKHRMGSAVRPLPGCTVLLRWCPSFGLGLTSGVCWVAAAAARTALRSGGGGGGPGQLVIRKLGLCVENGANPRGALVSLLQPRVIWHLASGLAGAKCLFDPVFCHIHHILLESQH